MSAIAIENQRRETDLSTNGSVPPAPATAPADVPDPVASAKAARLRYVSDARPGIRRMISGDEVRYVSPDGSPVDDAATLERIRKLAIPPAWTDVWICPVPNGHLQATGRDDRGRKQYRYHERWRQVRDETKYDHVIAFAQALPAIRRRVEEDLKRPGLPRDKVLAAIVRLLETTHIRVGNEEYVKQNHHYGLTTLRNRHVQVDGATLRFQFTGKSGKRHTIELEDRRAARVVRGCQDLPGQELFEYVDDGGETRSVGSSDVNDYLRDASGQDFTAKDFRTWAGTVLAATALAECEAFDSETQAKRNVTQAIEAVAERLGNTPAVCRKCYVHPQLIEAYLGGAALDGLADAAGENVGDTEGLRPEEQAVLQLLQGRRADERPR